MILGKHNNAKYAFLYMFSLVALLFVALGVGQVLFQAINKYVVDLLTTYSSQFNSGSLKFAISALIIAVPLYYITTIYLEKSLRKGELDAESAIRRWLTYFILFVSSVVMVVWLIITIGNFLDGQLTLKAGLKLITVLVIAGTIFSYYFYDIRRDKIKAKDLVIRIYLIATLVLTVGSLIFSFFFVETPSQARARLHDNTVLDHFTQLDSAINTYYTKNNRVPDSLEKAVEETPYLNLANYKDPLSAKSYEYKKIDDTTYQLCADFQADNRDPKNQENYADRWPHASGYQCLKQKALSFDQGGATKTVPVR